MYMLIGVLLAIVFVAPAHAQVHIDIGIRFPEPPRLVVVPEVRTVRYVPAGPANIFQYDGQYWAFANGNWHVSPEYNGPWIVVAPHFVPRPVLLVPVNYYRVPPGHWRQWDRRQPPRWGDDWGREWSEKREWKGRGHDRNERDGDHRKVHVTDHRKGRDKDDDKDHGKGHDKDRDKDRGKDRGRGR